MSKVAPKPNKRDIIRTHNDHFRTTLIGGKVMFSEEISILPERIKQAILLKVQGYKAFTKDNDPYGEHDFGSLTYNGETLLFKIDYYDKALTQGSPDPANPNLTTRVLTILFAHEY